MSKDGTRRRHIVDACQLLNKARTFKHTGATLESLVEVINATRTRAATRLALFRWLAFNLLVANDDCHLKNLSFYMGPDGVDLAPHYDIIGTGAWTTRAFAQERATWPTVEMAIKLPQTLYFGDVTPQVMMDAGRQLGLRENICARILGEMASRRLGRFAARSPGPGAAPASRSSTSRAFLCG